MSQTQTAPPDVRQLAQQELPQATFPGGRSAAFRIFMDPAIHARIHLHANEDTSVEICGVLVGKWARDADGPYAHVLECIRGDAAANKFAEVTFTHETWARINQQMDSRFSQMSIVGWYHSHPSFGIFLSERDRFIQEHFFSGPGQIALVVDPIRKTEGVFLWRVGKAQLCPHYWVGDRIQVGTAAGEEPPAALDRTELVPATSQPAASPSREPPLWTNLVMQLALYLGVFILGFFLAGKMSDLERMRIEQAVSARDLLYFNVRPGLRERLADVDADLQAAALGARTLAQEHLKLTEKPDEPKARWQEVLEKLDRSSKRLGTISDVYSLTPQEVAMLLSLTESKSRPSAGDKRQPKDDKTESKKSEEGVKDKPPPKDDKPVSNKTEEGAKDKGEIKNP